MMDYFILSRLSTNNFLIDAMILFALIPFVHFLSDLLKVHFLPFINKYRWSKWNVITFAGWNNIHNGIFYFDYPFPMTAICHYINQRNLSSNLRYINMLRNSNFFPDNLDKLHDKDHNISYLLDDKENIRIGNDIYIDIFTYKLDTSNENKTYSNTTNWKVNMSIKSSTRKIDELKHFVSDCIKEYKKFEEKKNLNKIYHFIYQGWDDSTNRPLFTQSILSNLDNENEKSYETFKTLFSEHKSSLIKSIDRLKNIEYYKRNGLKRKIGYLFYGPPGCGKTSHVMAMANYDNSHIMEIPMSRIKKNKEIEEIINITDINNISINKNNLIVFFDEIDQADGSLSKRDSEGPKEEVEGDTNKIILMNLLSQNKDNSKKTDFDSLNLGCILSRLDGIGNYNGLKIVASTNCKEKLSPALYRHGRLTPLYFDYCRREDIINMIEHFYQSRLSEKEIALLPDRTHQISPASLRKYLEDFEEDKKGLITFLNAKIK